MEKCGRGGSRCRLARPRLPSPRCLGLGEPRDPGDPGVRGPGGLGSGDPGLLPHLPALCFQCLEAAAACTSSTWAGVRGRLAGAGRPPGDPRVCLCPPWAVSSWPWSAEPSTCPIGEWRAPWRVVARWPPGASQGHGRRTQGAWTPELLGPGCPRARCQSWAWAPGMTPSRGEACLLPSPLPRRTPMPSLPP